MVVPKKAAFAYEESRLKRLQENKRRMEELNLNKLAQSLRPSPKPSPMKKTRNKVQLDLIPVRRSSRVSDKPAPNYKEMGFESLGIARRSYNYKRRDLLNRIYASDGDRMDALERAEALEQGLEKEFPSFVKPMLQSHVTGGFWLGLPVHFCKVHLPKHDEMITLVDENGEESVTKYLSLKTGLSGGWRGFALMHDLVDGDALVFQLVQPTTFKVYIIRVNEAAEEENGTD